MIYPVLMSRDRQGAVNPSNGKRYRFLAVAAR
jgi:hypothetical protein